MELAEKFSNDRGAYTDGKTEFVLNVLERIKNRKLVKFWYES
jgi:hypothetical protein